MAQEAAYMARLFGGDADVPTLEESVTRLDSLVSEEPRRMDDADRQLRTALGLRSGNG